MAEGGGGFAIGADGVAVLAVPRGQAEPGDGFDIVQIEMPPRPAPPAAEIRLAEWQHGQAKDVHHIEARIGPLARGAGQAARLRASGNDGRATA